MVSVLADTLEIEQSLRRLVALSETAGAEFNPDLVVKCIDGDLSIEAPPGSTGDVLIRLPWDCLLPLADFHFAIASNKFVIASHEPELTGTCVATMEAMLELYNLTNKLAVHRGTSPWVLAASHPELLPNLLAGRRFRLHELIVSGNQCALELRSFFKTRSYGYSDMPEGPRSHLLLPVLDAMNHHSQGAPIRLHDRGARGPVLTITRSFPLPGTGNECFACYCVQDCFDCWMNYGFVDATPSFVRSLAIDIDIPGYGTIRTADIFANRDEQDLASSVGDLHFYIPKLFARRQNQIDVGSVLLPGPQAPSALRRTLHFLIAELGPGRPPPRELVVHAERQVIAANTAYYQTLAAFLHAMPLTDVLQRPILENFIRVCELQLGRLRAYTGYARD
jgi:hypothetical protein